eukprot:66008-Alexandrium_andersonii.AAC.1
MDSMLQRHDLANLRIEVAAQEHRKLGPPSNFTKDGLQEATGGADLWHINRTGVGINRDDHG